MKSTLFTLLTLASQLRQVECFWRMICDKPIVTARIDPIISSGAVSAHTHSVTGPSDFDYAATYADLRGSNCTTCQVTQDHSAYWVPQLYYTHENGTYEAVGMTGGLTVYYLPRGDPGPAGKILAVPNGLRMIAGDPFRRSYNSSDVAQRAMGFSCLGGVGYTKSLEGINNCPNGLRAEVFFPNCWDGVNLDSADHSSHMAYSGDDGNGGCPSSHPVKLVSLFYEAMWSIDPFKDGWWNGTAPPFVFAQGDPTGYGSHGDFMSGWDADFLQKAVDTCTNNSGLIQDCALFDIDYDSAGSCNWNKSPIISEDVFGIADPLSALPGCNPVTYGPEEAPVHPSICPNGQTASILAAAVSVVSVPTSSSSTTPGKSSTVTRSSGALVAAEARTLVSDSTTSKTAGQRTSSSFITVSSSKSLSVLAAAKLPLYSNHTTTFAATSPSSTVTQVVTVDVAGVHSVYTTTIYMTETAAAAAVAATTSMSTAAVKAALTDGGAAVDAAATDTDDSATEDKSVSSDPATSGSDVAAAITGDDGFDSDDSYSDGEDSTVTNVVFVTQESVSYYTVTTTLYESASPFVQLYVIPQTVSRVVTSTEISTTANGPSVTTTARPRTRTSTVYETMTQTTVMHVPVDAAAATAAAAAAAAGAQFATMSVVGSFPAMGIFQNTSSSSSSSSAINVTALESMKNETIVLTTRLFG